MIKIISAFLFLILISQQLYSQDWTQSLNGRSVWSLAKDSQGYIYAGGLTSSNSRIWRSTTGGSSWDTIYTGIGQTMWDFAFTATGTIYVANFSNGLLKSTNNGANFTVIPLITFHDKNVQGVECGAAENVFVTTSMGFFRSTNGGANFTETALTGLNCLPVLVDIYDQDIVYVGVSSATGTGIGFYRSTNAGLTFSENLNPGKNGYNIFQKPSGDLYMITTTAPYNFDRSTNKGLTWTTVSNLPGAQRGITISGSNNIFTSGNGGVFRSIDNGSTFVNHNFTISATPALTIDYSGVIKILVGASGSANGGVWSCVDAIIQSISTGNETPDGFTLSQNYPNPFNPNTVINYSVPPGKGQEILLSVYNELGLEIKTLVNELQDPGSYKINFDGNGLPAGVYYCRLQTGSLNITKKMLLIK